MSLPAVFRAPDGKGSAIHPLLLALYHTAPSLVKAVTASNTGDETLSKAVKQAWSALEKDSPSTKPVWDLIGEDKLIPVDSAELLAQMCDLFDSELKDAAADALGVSTKSVIESGARVKEGKPFNGYYLPLSIPIRGEIGGFRLSTLLEKDFETEKIDFMFPDDVEPVLSSKQLLITDKPHEVLVIHLQRYKYNFESMSNAKIYDRVEFPQTLSGSDLAKYGDEGAAKAYAPCSFELTAVVTHSDEKGYGLLLRPDAKGPWFRCCDPDTQDVPTETSLESVFGGDVGGDIAYLLFYKASGNRRQSTLASAVRRLSRASGKAEPATTTASKPAAAESRPDATAAIKAPAKSGGGGGCCTIQ